MASARDIEAASAYVRLYTKGAEWAKGLKNAGDQLNAMGKRVNEMAGKLAAAGGAIAAPLVASITAYVAVGDKLDKMSQRLGTSTNALSELDYAAKLSGTSIETLEGVIRSIRVSTDKATKGDVELNKTFTMLGLNAMQLKRMKPDEQFELIADRLSKIPDETRRATLGMAIMGGAVVDLFPMMADGAKGIKRLREEAREMGLSIDAGQASAAAALADALALLSRVVTRLAFSVGNALGPEIIQISKWFSRVIADSTAWIDKNKELVVWIAKLAAGLIAASAVLLAIGAGIQFAGFTLFGLSIILKSFSSGLQGIGTVGAYAFKVVAGAGRMAFAALLTPVGAALAVIIGLYAYLLSGSTKGVEALGHLAEGFEGMRATAVTAWGGIVAAIASGDFATAGQIAFQSLNVFWLEAVAAMQGAWDDLCTWLASPFIRASDAITDVWVSTIYGLADVWNTVSTSMMVAWDALTTGLTSAWDTFVSYATGAWTEFAAFFQQLWANILTIYDQEAGDRMTKSIADAKLLHRQNAGKRQSALDAKRAENTKGYEERTRQNGASQMKYATEVENNRKALRAALQGVRAARDRASNQDSPELLAARAELKASKDKLDEVTKKAKESQNATVNGSKTTTGAAPTTNDVAEAMGKISATGAFSGLGAFHLGGGAGGSRDQVSLLKEIAKQTKETAENTKGNKNYNLNQSFGP